MKSGYDTKTMVSWIKGKNIAALVLILAVAGLAPAAFAQTWSDTDACNVQDQCTCEEIEAGLCPPGSGGFVSLFRGNLYHEEPIFFIPGPGLGNDFTLNFKNKNGYHRLFGYGWHSPLDFRLYDGCELYYPGAFVQLSDFDGSQRLFDDWDGDGVYTHSEGHFDMLVRNADETFDLTRINGIRYHFGSDGLPESVTDRNGNRIAYRYATIPVAEFAPLRTFTIDFENNPHMDWGALSAAGSDAAGCHLANIRGRRGLVQVTSALGETLNGNYSLKVGVTAPIGFTSLMMTSGKLIEPNTEYRVSFKYKCLQDFGNGYLDVSLWTSHCIEWVTHELKPVTGESSVFSFTITTDRLPPYRLYFDFYNVTRAGALIIDDFTIEEVNRFEETTKEVPVEITDAAGRKTYLEYGLNGLVSKITDSAGREYEFGYDADLNLVSIAAPQGKVSTFTYNETHDLTSKTDASGRTWTVRYYKGANSVDGWENADGATQEMRREWTGNHARYSLVTSSDGNGNETKNTVRVARGVTYGETLVKVEDAQGGVRELEWNDQIRVAKEVFKDPVTLETNVTSYTYDAWGMRTSMRDTQGHTNVTVYDPVFHNKPVKVTDEAGQVTEYEYDGQGNLALVTDPAGATTWYGYDARGNQISVEDALGGMTRYGYDAAGNRVSVWDSLGNLTAYTYDARGNVLSMTDALGQTTFYEYDALNRLTAMTDPRGNRMVYGYDVNGNKISETDALGRVTRFEYDDKDRLTAVIDPLGNVTRFTYDRNGNRASMTDPLGNTTLYFYDGLNRLIAEQDAFGNVTRYAYDGRGNRISVTDALGNVTRFGYDNLNRLVSVTDAEGRTSFYGYDAKGRKISFTDPEGNVTRYQYDAADRLIGVLDPVGGLTQYGYDAAGRQVSLTDPLGGVTRYAYDAAGRRTAETDALGRVTHYQYDNAGRLAAAIDAGGATNRYEYDAAGNQTAMVDALGNRTKYEYDAANRLTAVVDPLGKRTVYEYDSAGNRVAVVDSLGRRTRYEYDALRRVIAKIDPDGNRTEFGYDARGNMVSVKDALGRVTGYEYDALNQLTAVVDALGQRTVLGYDPLGRLTLETDANGTTRTFAYNWRGNLVRKVYPDGKVYIWVYDARGNMLTKTVAGVLLEQNFYDALNRLTCRAITGKGRIDYGYDAVGNVTNFTDQMNGVTRYGYDALNRMVEITDARGKTTTYAYDRLGRRTRRAYPNGCISSYAYDSRSALTLLQNLSPRGKILSSFAYTYDAVGQRTRVEEQERVRRYGYDNLGQLVRADIDSGGRCEKGKDYQVSYVYDAAGNRLAMEMDAEHGLSRSEHDQALPFDEYSPTLDDEPELKHPVRVEYAYNELNQLLREKAYRLTPAGQPWYQTAYEYDPNGNVVEKAVLKKNAERGRSADRGEVTKYAYDYANLLTLIKYPGGESNTFKNCRCGTFRLQKADSTGLRNYLYDQANDSPIFEYDAGFHLLAGYVKGPVIDELISRTEYEVCGGSRTFYYLYDGHGSVCQMVDERGEVMAEYDYLPFGEIIEAEGREAKRNVFTYTGREYDRDSGLYYFRARYMAPRVGRFIEKDPVLIKRLESSIPAVLSPSGTGSGVSPCCGNSFASPIQSLYWPGRYSSTITYYSVQLRTWQMWAWVSPNLYLGLDNDPIDKTDPKGLEIPPWTPPRPDAISCAGNNVCFPVTDEHCEFCIFERVGAFYTVDCGCGKKKTCMNRKHCTTWSFCCNETVVTVTKWRPADPVCGPCQ